MPYGKRSGTLCAGTPKAWHTASRPCSIEVEARAGNPIISPNRIDAGDLGLVVLVDHKAAATVGDEPGLGEVEAGSAGATDRVEGFLGNDRLSAVEVQPDARA